METTSDTIADVSMPQSISDIDSKNPFSHQQVSITKAEYVDLAQKANYWKAQHAHLKEKCARLEEECQRKDARIRDLQNRVFGKKSEKQSTANSEKPASSAAKRPRGQQPGSQGHGRTPRPDLPVINETIDLQDAQKCCPCCGLSRIPRPALDETSDVIEVEVQAYIRRLHRPAYVRNPGCQCADVPAVVTAPPPPRLIPRSPYAVSFWVEILLSKFQYSQPTHRHLQDLADRSLPVSPGAVAGGLQTIASLFEPIMASLLQKQMTEALFHNDETRWEVFVEVEGKVGHRWYLWVTRSKSVVYFVLDPTRSTEVPGAHFAGLQEGRVIIVCDRYSAYKKLARLMPAILLAFCWAHVRRDYLDAGRSYKVLEPWALNWKERIGELYHRNHLRLDHWDSECPLDKQSETFNQHHQAVQETLQAMLEAATLLSKDDEEQDEATLALPRSARKQQRKVCKSLLTHWPGLTLFVENPQVPLDNNLAENTIRGPVTGRKNYYGSGSLWSATLASTAFSIFKTLGLWGINTRHWLSAYLIACAENGGKPPTDITPWLPWSMDEIRRSELARPPPAKLSLASPDTS
jgi:transposase